jgi:hypothetical protein
MDTFKGIDLSLVSQKIIKTLDESALSSYGGTSGSLESIKDRFNFLHICTRVEPEKRFRKNLSVILNLE